MSVLAILLPGEYQQVLRHELVLRASKFYTAFDQTQVALTADMLEQLTNYPKKLGKQHHLKRYLSNFR
jgi:hypothetical protein